MVICGHLWSYVVMGGHGYGHENDDQNSYGHGSDHLLSGHFGINPQIK